MVRIVAIGAVLIAVMISIKDRRLLQRTHMTGFCSTVQERADGSEWRKCVGGRLTGPPGLAMAGCDDFGWYSNGEFWHCPAALAQNTIRQ